MRHVLAVARRELESYFASPIAYAVMTIFTFVSGLFFSSILVFAIRQAALADSQLEKLGRSDFQLDVPTSVLSQFFQNEAFLLMFALPLLTMGLMTDERRKGTLELLLTSPVRATELALGKFLGALGLVSVLLVPLLPMFYFLAQGGDWEPGVVASGLLGLLLLAGAQIGLGLFISSLCENVLVAAIGTYGVLMTLQFIDASAAGTQSIWTKLVAYFSFYMRQQNSTRGFILVEDVIYFVSYIALGLFLTQRSIEAIRYKRT
ncbi:MAG: ABC transporter permease [Acidobacteriota bacterium]